MPFRKVSYSTIRLESTSSNSRSRSPRKRKKLFKAVVYVSAVRLLPIFFSSCMSCRAKERKPPQSAGEENTSTTLSAVYPVSERSSRAMTLRSRDRSSAMAVFMESR